MRHSLNYTGRPGASAQDTLPELMSAFPDDSSPASPASQSPAKLQMRMDPLNRASDAVSTGLHNDSAISSLQSSIAQFPTTGQSVLDTTMKDMLLSLQSSLMSNLLSLINQFSLEMKYMDNRMHFMENKMEEFTNTVNDLVDAYTEQKDDSLWIKTKLADLENRSRRNNIKTRGIPESVQPRELHNFTSTMFSSMLPELSPIELTIDCIHRFFSRQKNKFF